jgi:(1->4)-alpha-D-glucan 1-alpha-D-glucosylmutase
MRIPLCTYRLQLNKDFTFRNATAILPYLDALGISDVYLSPFFASRPGSAHGYDVVDPGRLNPEIGTDEDFDALAAGLKARGMGLLMDVVPNHMCIASTENRWWMDVLENGRSSPYAAFFDINWRPPKTELQEKVLLPVLGEQYGRVLENQELAIGYAGGAFFVGYGSSRFPIGPRTIRPLLEPVVENLARNHPLDHPDLLELESILTAIKHIPSRSDTQPEQVRERQREKEIVKRRIAALVERNAAVRDALDQSLAAINGHKGHPRSFDRLEGLLADQAYRLSFWGVAAEEINYRRFFDINDLAALRVEDPDVLAAVHDRAFALVAAGKVTGLRIDHVDGLYDPRRYLENLQTIRHADPAAEGSGYVVVEKILIGDEALPPEWPVQGTTGYDFLNVLNGLFVDPAGARAIERLYQRLREGGGTFDDLLYRAKKLILRTAMSSELFVLAQRLDRISEHHRWSRDFTLNSLHLALGEVIACFPVYRTYVQTETGEVGARDRQHVLRAIRDAKRRNRATSESIFDFVADVMLLRDPEGLTDADRSERREFVLRLQQLTGPVMAKGLEDTVFYRYFPLSSLNEVGSQPTAGPTDVDQFHAWNARRLASWPHALSATATHDTKRGEDLRLRLDALSEIPRDWQHTVRRWQRINRRKKPLVDEVRVPEANEEYLLYQTLLGMWPFAVPDAEGHQALVERVSAYMNKALREAKVHSTWINVNQPYEAAVDEFLRRILADTSDNAFLADLRRIAPTLATPGLYSSLTQVVLKATSPGVPDFYQGTELWDLSLVDPDNRRPVDFGARQERLADLTARAEADAPALIAELLANAGDGAIKLFVTARVLGHRRRRRALYERGSYVPLVPEGAQRHHVIAFARAQNGSHAIVVAGRFFAAMGADTTPPLGESAWLDTSLLLDRSLHAPEYRDAISGRIIRPRSDAERTLRLGDVFSSLPVAVLEPT